MLLRTKAKFLVILVLGGCSSSAANDPVTRAAEFIKLARAGKCREAFVNYTAASQQNLRDFSNKLKENSQYYTEVNEPYHLHCHVLAEYLPKTVTQTGQSRRGDTAYMRAIMRTGSYIPIPFFSDPIKNTPVEFSMARENGVWKMVAPFVQVENPHRHELKVGKFIVDWARRPATEVRGFRTSGVLAVAPEDVEAVLLDFDRWSSWMPHVQEARALTQPSDTVRPRKQLVYVRHAATADGPAVDFVIEFTNNARTSDAGNRAFTGSWRAVTHSIASPPRTKRGTVWGVNFSARPDLKHATRMDFGYAATPAEWPPESQPVVFQPEHGPAILSALEREAMRRASSNK